MNSASLRGAPAGATAGTAVLAGCGDLGTRVGLRLARGGRRVLGLRRDPAPLPDPLTVQAVDLRRETPVLPRDTAVVVVALSADARTADAYRATFLNGVGHVLDAAAQVDGDPRILLVTSTAVHGADDGRWIDEDDPVGPTTATGRVLREAEELLHARRPGATALRLGGLYGPGRGRLAASVREGTAKRPPGPQYTNRIHIDDAAAAIAHLCSRAAAPAPHYLGVDDDPADRGEVLDFLAGALGVALPEEEQPAQSGAGSSAAQRGRGKRCRNARLRATGFEFTYPSYREGYRAILGAR